MALKIVELTEKDLAQIARNMEVEAEDWLHNASDEVVGCRGEGHNWPKLLDRRKRNTRHMRMDPPYEIDGAWQLVQTCMNDCGKIRRVDLQRESDGTFTISLPAKFSYWQPKPFTAPKGVKVTRRMAYAECWRRSEEELRQLSLQATVAAAEQPEMVMDENAVPFLAPNLAEKGAS